MVIVWHRGKARVNRLLGNAFPWMRTVQEQTCRLPYELVEMVVACLTRDQETLKACSLTCRSWYIAVVPHLHHTLTLRGKIRGKSGGGFKALSELHGGRVPPVIKEIRVWQSFGTKPWFVPQAFSRRHLRYWSAFANIQTLRLQDLQIFRFIPSIKRYFGHFSPTLRSIALFEPRCTARQLSYFLSLFSNLDDIRIRTPKRPPDKAMSDTALVPLSAPSLRGRLRLYRFRWVETWTQLITSCGGLRFRYVNLRLVEDCAPILLEACAETLEVLRFYVTEWDRPIGKQVSMSLSTDSS